MHGHMNVKKYTKRPLLVRIRRFWASWLFIEIFENFHLLIVHVFSEFAERWLVPEGPYPVPFTVSRGFPVLFYCSSIPQPGAN